MAAQHGGQLPKNCAEGGTTASLGLSSEALTLEAAQEGSMAGGHMAGKAAHLAKHKSAAPQGDFSAD